LLSEGFTISRAILFLSSLRGKGVSSTGSVTHWIGLLKGGDSLAAQKVWDGYFQRLVGLARKKLRGLPRTSSGAEDVALSAFASFCRCAEQGKFPLLTDRHDLWRLLVVIAARKAVDLLNRERRLKRGGAALQKEVEVEELIGREPTPDFAAQVADEFRHLLDCLNDDELRQVATWKLEGYTNNEIAAKLGRSPTTVERKMNLIRRIWKREMRP
jgi:DNA-directed RNA polymerase specialized sigma24 family protein